MTITLQATKDGEIYSIITMEQKYTGGKVKIDVKSQFSWERRVSHSTIWADKDDANKFYSNRIKDGYKRV